MKKRLNNQLPNNLPQLQNLIKRDPASYKDEFLQQYHHYHSLIQVFRLKPSEHNQSLDDVVMFLAQVSHCFSEDLAEFPQELVELLQKHHNVLEPRMRMTFCRALILLRSKSLLGPSDLLSLFFHLLRCQDKQLRNFLQAYIISDIKNLNAKHKNAKLNKTLQNFMFSMLKDQNAVAVKMSLDIMIDLYKKNIWDDHKTVNVIAMACFSKIVKVMVAALQFFLGKDEDIEGNDESDTEDETPTFREVAMANKFNKKSRKRKKLLEKTKQVVKKSKKKKKALTFNFSAIHLIYDPQGMAEKLLKSLETMNERYEVKLMVMNLVSRLVGIHELILLNFYPLLQRFIQPHQRDVTRILQYSAQAAHGQVPPDTLEPLLKTIANNFITERNSSEVMAVGLNAIREICARCPLSMGEDLLQDLVQYKSYRDKSVMMAARSLLQLYRSVNPGLLLKKDRGRPTEAIQELKVRQYGELLALDYLPGAEILPEKGEDKGLEKNRKSKEEKKDDSDGSWIDVCHSSDEEFLDEKGDKSKEQCEFGKSGISLETKVSKATNISQSRILSQEDFQKLHVAQLAKHITSTKGKKSPMKRKSEDKDENISSRKDIVPLGDIERINKRPRHDRESRLATVMGGREGREKFGRKNTKNPLAGRTQKEHNKNKAFMMIKYKVKSKAKRSFRDKQIALRNSLLKQQKMK